MSHQRKAEFKELVLQGGKFVIYGFILIVTFVFFVLIMPLLAIYFGWGFAS